VATRSPAATRHDLQPGRRVFHLLNGSTVATAYALLFTHEQVVHLFGTIACVVYVLDRIRIAYPDVVARRAPWVNRLLVRAEEEVREAAMTPYAIAVLLTILTVPKFAALIAIYTLAIADPLAAVVGIRYGTHPLVRNRTLEGSGAFFGATLVISAVVLATTTAGPAVAVAGAAVAIALVATLFELIPLRIDDNLTIPLAVGFAAWVIPHLCGVVLL
jgi:dolichol kinase